MSLSRWWTDTTAAIEDVLPLPLAALLLLLTAGLIALLWYTFPAWVPRRWPRLGRRRRKPTADQQQPEPVTEPVPAEPEPAPPPAPAPPAGDLADRLAAEGRYAESVRERLRGMVQELVDHRVLEHRPGLTVPELAEAATRVRPPVRDPFVAAGRIFSDLWYAQHSARPAHDERMRELSGELRRVLTTPPGEGTRQ